MSGVTLRSAALPAALPLVERRPADHCQPSSRFSTSARAASAASGWTSLARRHAATRCSPASTCRSAGRPSAPLVILSTASPAPRTVSTFSAWRACCSTAAARPAAQPARRGAVAAALPAALLCRPQPGFPRSAGAPARGRLRRTAWSQSAIRWAARCCSNIWARKGPRPPLQAAATVCAPIDLAVTCRHMMRPRNRLYHRYILGDDEGRGDGRGRGRSRRPSAPPSSGRDPSGNTTTPSSPRATASPARRTTTSAAGRRATWPPSASRRWCWRALDDPWIPGALYRAMIGRGTGRSRRCCPRREAMSASMARGSRQPWSDLAVARFFEHG